MPLPCSTSLVQYSSWPLGLRFSRHVVLYFVERRVSGALERRERDQFCSQVGLVLVRVHPKGVTGESSQVKTSRPTHGCSSM